MLGLFRRVRPRVVGTSGRAALHLEALEWRYQLDATPLGDPPSGGPVVVAPNAPPVISGLHAREITNGLFLITGTVLDESPGGLTVTFGGGTSARGSVVTAADGTFSWLVQLKVDGTDCGFLTANTVDAQGLAAEEEIYFLDPTSP